MDFIITEQEGIMTFTINRPERRNAINYAVMEGLEEAIEYIHNHETVRAFVITGTGDQAFCSGGDLAEFHHLITEEEAYSMLSKMAEILYDLATLPIPTIALINGVAVGGGCEIAAACDFRLVKKGARCGFIQGTLGITTGWGGGTYLLERGLQQEKALKMLLEARLYNAEQLFAMGFAQYIFEGEKNEAIKAFLADMEKIQPSVQKAYKEILIRKWNSQHLKERVMEEVRTCAKLWESEAHHQAVKQFLSKTK